MDNITLRHISVTTVAVERQYALNININNNNNNIY